jgi:murein DD-endopeptidase MepM/ murein hydrolase activator NlpD
MAIKRKIALPKALQSDNREFTIMLVPHKGQKVFSVRLPMNAIKAVTVVLAAVVIVTAGTLINYHHTINAAQDDKLELERLRQTNSQQYAQIQQLAQATTSLQADMDRLNDVETQIRRLINNDETNETSRAGIVRPGRHGGQGGPVVKPDLATVTANINQLQAAVKVREESLNNLRDTLVSRNARIAATPSIWPTNGEVTSRFGSRSSPWGWGSDWHPGYDIAGDYGTPVVATADGVVVYSGWYGGYGRLVQIDHGNGIVTLYGHNSEIIVNDGQQVKKGQVISYMGSTGNSTGPHVHYEVRVNGTALNPANFL